MTSAFAHNAVDMAMDLETTSADVSVDQIVRSSHEGAPCLLIRGRRPVGAGIFVPVEFRIGFSHTLTTWRRDVAPARA